MKRVRSTRTRGRYQYDHFIHSQPLTLGWRIVMIWQTIVNKIAAPIWAIRVVCNPELINIDTYYPAERRDARELKHMAYQARMFWRIMWEHPEGKLLIGMIALTLLYAVVLMVQP